jgi:hypothetical protein
MINPRLLKIAERLGSAELPNIPQVTASLGNMGNTLDIGKHVAFPPIVNPFTLAYNQYGAKILQAMNQYFAGTPIAIDTSIFKSNIYPQNIQGTIFQRCAFNTAIYNDSELRKQNIWPITPQQSEQWLEYSGNPNYNEPLAFVLYGDEGKTGNAKYAQALKDSIANNLDVLNLRYSDLEKAMLVVNAGLERDEKFEKGVRPIVLPGVTRVYTPDALGNDQFYFKGYGLKTGLPAKSSKVDSNYSGSKRGFWEETKTGLSVLRRGDNTNLYVFAEPFSINGSFSFATQGTVRNRRKK